MTDWQAYSALHPTHIVVGDLRVYLQLYSPQLNNSRDILVLLPPSYEHSTRRYPVLYMHDGNNLFDDHASYAGEWQVDETLRELSAEQYEAIVVGLPNQGDFRIMEYNPYPLPQAPGRGADYIRFIVETVKPLIDHTFRTLPRREMTGIAGSSMGGLISLYGYMIRPDIFGFCGAFSPAYWFGNEGLLHTARQHSEDGGKIYMDVGTQEGDTLLKFFAEYQDNLPAAHEAYVQGVRRLRDALQQGGYHEGESLHYVEEAGAIHHESAWARRLPDALRFLIPRP